MPHHRAFLIDGTAFCYRAFYAIRSLSTADGRPTNAVYGFAMMLKALRAAQRPEYLAVAFDAGKPTFRHARYDAYKRHRKPMPDPLIGQLPLIRELLEGYRVPVFQMEGYEGEDVLATIAKQIAGPHTEVFLVTGDKDALQLVGPQLTVYNPHAEPAMLDAQAVEARYGVPPACIADLIALMGDTSDNIPGVPGIGEKTASELLKQFRTLGALYERLEEVHSPSHRAALQERREQVELARELATINSGAPLTVRLDDLAVQEPDWLRLRGLFKRLEFKRLLAESEAQCPVSTDESGAIHWVDDASSAQRLLAALTTARPALVAVRDWWAPAPDREALVLLTVALVPQETWCIPLAHGPGPWLRPVLALLAGAQVRKIGHDVKRLLRWWEVSQGDAAGGLDGDTMIAAHLLDSAQTDPSLPEVSEQWAQVSLGPVTPDVIQHHRASPHMLAQHTQALLTLHPRLTRELQAVGMEALYRDLELPLVGILARMEQRGIAVDRERLVAMRTQMAATLEKLTQELYALAGGPFNLNSPKQLAEVLFERLGLPVVKRTKTGPSTDSEVLQKLAASHPVPKRVLDYRELNKLVSTYLDALPKAIDPATGRLHTTYHQTGTATGRLSSSDPNLQNIPIKTDVGRQIRHAFMAGENGWLLTAADYSQIELRILAHLSQDRHLMAAFQSDGDIHRSVASLVYGVPEAEVTPVMRQAMKAVNYGIIYGMSAHGLARELGCPQEEAAAFITAYFQQYPSVRGFLDEQITRAKRDGYVSTLLGRRRYIREIASPDAAMRQFAERMAINAPIQGTAADLIKLAMIRVEEELRHRKMRSALILQVHDELVCEGPAEEAEALAQALRDRMERALELSVPLRVIVKRGPNWLDLLPVYGS